MLIGGLNFAFSYHLFTLKIKKILSREVLLFLAIIGVATLLVAAAASIDIFDSLFHVISMSSSQDSTTYLFLLSETLDLPFSCS